MNKKKYIYISVIVILLLLLISAVVYIVCSPCVDKPSLPTDTNAVEYEGDKPTNRFLNHRIHLSDFPKMFPKTANSFPKTNKPPKNKFAIIYAISENH